MPSITVPGFASSYKVPGIFLFSLFGGGSASAGARSRAHALVGNAIGTAISGSAPTLAVAAGTATANTRYFLASAEDAAVYFGRGSELHRMAKAFFRQHPTGTCYAVAVPESSGSGLARASATVTFVNAATGQVTFRLRVGGETIELPINGSSSSSVAIATIAENLCDAINGRTDCPVTAQFSGGVVTITAKNYGPRGNQLEFSAEWVSTAGIVTTITASAIDSGVTTTCALSTAGGVLTSGAAGATAETIASALDALSTQQYSIAIAQNDATALGALSTWLSSQAGVTLQFRNQAVACMRSSLATAAGVVDNLNNPRLQVVWHYNSPTPCDEVAAQVLAARSIGDTAAGGVLVGEETDPAANLDGLMLRDVQTQRAAADEPTPTELNSALGQGLAPIVPTSGRHAYGSLCSSVTTRFLVDGQTNYAVWQTSIVTGVDYVADSIRAAYAATFRGFKLAADSADGAPLKIANTTTPKLVRSWVFGRLKGYEAEGVLRNVDAHKSELQVVEDNTLAGRLLAEIPAETVPGLHQLAGNVRQAS